MNFCVRLLLLRENLLKSLNLKLYVNDTGEELVSSSLRYWLVSIQRSLALELTEVRTLYYRGVRQDKTIDSGPFVFLEAQTGI